MTTSIPNENYVDISIYNKKVIWFGHEKGYKSVEDLYAAIDDFIKWCNEERIQHKLKGLSPSLYNTGNKPLN
ncbi:MAG: IS3 family transposase [Spirochaetales bacterium]|nr:IS3 family transposase [Spirochaetales bacterium]